MCSDQLLGAQISCSVTKHLPDPATFSAVVPSCETSSKQCPACGGLLQTPRFSGLNPKGVIESDNARKFVERGRSWNLAKIPAGLRHDLDASDTCKMMGLPGHLGSMTSSGVKLLKTGSPPWAWRRLARKPGPHPLPRLDVNIDATDATITTT